MIIITKELDLPDYFRREEIEPDVADGGCYLTIYQASKESESGMGSYVILNDDDLTSVLVGYYFSGLSRKARSKARGGQFWRHYKNEVETPWRWLTDSDRIRILDAERPEWARAPGKLASQRYKPHHHKQVERDNTGAILGYKYLIWIEEIVDGETVGHFQSIFRPERFKNGKAYGFIARWHNNQLTADEIPTEENRNGIYAAKTFDSPVLKDYKSAQSTGEVDLRLVRLLLCGKVLELDYIYRAEEAHILEVLE